MWSQIMRLTHFNLGRSFIPQRFGKQQKSISNRIYCSEKEEGEYKKISFIRIGGNGSTELGTKFKTKNLRKYTLDILIEAHNLRLVIMSRTQNMRN